jgi:hypothetical protein
MPPREPDRRLQREIRRDFPPPGFPADLGDFRPQKFRRFPGVSGRLSGTISADN